MGRSAAIDRPSFNLGRRVNAALVIAAVVLFTVALRLWYLQVLKGSYFRDRSENNRIRTVFIPPPRGVIFDRWGQPVVRNRPAFNIEFVSEDSPNPSESLKALGEILSLDPAELKERLNNQSKRRRFEPKILLKDVSRDVVAKVAAHNYQLPGVVINVVPARDYMYGTFASHILGYIREITRPQLENSEFQGRGYLYRQGDLVGQYGIESKWEADLQGKRGMRGVIVNANGVRIGEASFESEMPGNSVNLTIDYDVQKAADEALKDKKGAIVALDPKSGEVLAISSAPAFDPNLFAGEISAQDWARLVTGKEKVLNNRAVQGSFPPGSVFKIFMSVAALSEGVINTKERINCPGHFSMGSRVFRCHKKEGHGAVNLIQAIQQSCDVFFYTVGNRLGVDRIHDYATLFGLGQLSGLDLVTEAPGLVPSTAWKKAYFRKPEMQKWYPGETPSVSIGQGAVTLTPLQIARGLAAVVNGGTLFRPRLILGGESSAGKWRFADFNSEVPVRTGIDPEVLKVVREGMEAVVNIPGGTGKRAQLDPIFNVTVAGKTGTAQVIGADAVKGGDHQDDHAWFAGYAPAEDPEIVVVALYENGGHGGVASAPLSKAVMEAYFRKQCTVPGGKCRMIPPKEKEESKKDGTKT
ncbi:MAG: penicillin-binding protein 2 [Oligoflexia bacterium]|nr:penicillin-binding protein 2 [Oligoflexia bacterium]